MSNDAQRLENVKTFVEFIQTHAETNVLKSYVEKLSKETIEGYSNEHGMDALHCAIIANNVEAASLLFHRGFFKPPHEYSKLSYMHLAARLGQKTILSMLLQERPGDNKAILFTYKTRNEYQRFLNNAKLFDEDDLTKRTPLDLAGKSGHVGCVKTILDHSHGKKMSGGRFKGNEAYIEMACQLDSPHALRLLLSQNPSGEDVKSAVGSALKLAKPECLDVLLRLGTDLSNLFEGMNLFHVLYSYSLSFDKKWYERMLAITTVLIRHGHSTCACTPFRTYPLYSLLSHSCCHDFDNSAPYLIACMLLLLNAGADPNFDEIDFERRTGSLRIKTAFGRGAFSSAIHCLFYNIQEYLQLLEENRYVKKYIHKCIEALLKHNAKPNVVDQLDDERGFRGNSLHGYFKVAPRTGIDQTTLVLLLRHGADPSLKVDNNYPITVFVESLLTSCDENSCLVKKSEIGPVVDMIHTMSLTSVRESTEIFLDIEKEHELHLGRRQQEVYDVIKSECSSLLKDVWSLKKFCSLCILDSCGREMPKILKLPLPMALKTKMTGIGIDAS